MLTMLRRGVAAIFGLACLFSACLALPALWRAAVAQTAVDLELVLAVDISLSMDLDELRIQRGGYVAAFRDPELQRVMTSGPHRRIAVTYFEWAGLSVQKLIVPWTVLDGAAAANAFADALERAPTSRERFTSISGAMEYAGRLFDQSPHAAQRRVLDISGDGPNNQGRLVTIARDDLLAKGIGINGLPVVLKSPGTIFDLRDLDLYYQSCVIGGPGAFTIPVRSEDEFAPAIRRKLLLEIAGRTALPRLWRVQATSPPAAGPDCTVGERLWRRYMDERNP